MRPRLAALLLLAATLGSCVQTPASLVREQQPRLGRQIPAFSPAATINEAAAPAAGRWTVVNHWHFFCGPCVEELPALEAFSAAHPEIAVVGVSYLFDPSEMPVEVQLGHFRRAVAAKGVTFPTLLAGRREDLAGFDFRTIPTTLLVSPQNAVEAELRGAKGLPWFLARAAQRVRDATPHLSTAPPGEHSPPASSPASPGL